LPGWFPLICVAVAVSPAAAAAAGGGGADANDMSLVRVCASLMLLLRVSINDRGRPPRDDAQCPAHHAVSPSTSLPVHPQ